MDAPSASPDANPVTVVGLISASPGSGRTGAITNVGWILASAGKKVLIIDWASERPRIHDYLRPFYLANSAVTDLPGYKQDLLPGLEVAGPGTGPAGGLRKYAVPVGVRRLHVLGPGQDPDADTEAGEPFGPPTGLQVAQWWEGLRDLHYDYVLIDWPTDTSREALARVSELCDVVGVMFMPRRSEVEAAGLVAHEVVTAARQHAKVVPVPTQFDLRNEDRVRRSRELVRSTFAGQIPDARSRHDPVELPYYPYDDYDEALAVLVDEPGSPETLLAAYERLAATITGNQVVALTPPPGATRDRYRHRLNLPAPEQVWRIAVAYSVPNRPWADWVRQRLTRAGAQVVMVSSETEWPAGEMVPSLVMISSPHLPESATVAQIARINEAAAPAPVDLIGLRLSDDSAYRGDRMADTGSATADVITVGKRSEAELGGELLAHFGLFDQPGAQGREPIRFPGDAAGPIRTNLLPRNALFVGRELDLELVRDRVTGPRTANQWCLTGPPGVGKSELAREYAHRFGYDYDLVWWIPAHHPVAARAALLQLAEVQLRTETGDAVRAVLTALRDGTWFGRTLLIYDNAEHLDLLGGLSLLPDGSAPVDVLITTRDATAAPNSEVIEVAAFDGAQSRDLLCGQVDGLSPGDGERIAAALDRLPLALGLAAGWLRESVSALRARGATLARSAELATADFLERLTLADPGVTDLSPALARTLGVVLARMAETGHGRLAVGLAQLCAYLSPDGVSVDLLRSKVMLDRFRTSVSAEDSAPLRLDTEELDEVLWTAANNRLFEVNWGRQPSLIMHRSLQDLMRSATGGLTRDDALAGLAAYAPTEIAPDPADARARFDEVQRHLFPSGALRSTDDAVRRWMVNHLRYLYVNADGETWRYAVSVAENLSSSWRAAFGAEDELRLRLDGQIANLHRALGDHERARRLDEATLEIRQRTLGLRHRQTLVSTRGRAADLRNLGRYQDAYIEDNEAWEGFRAILGDDHTHTRMAAHNLAISAYLFGDVTKALEIHRDAHQRLLRLFGRDHLDTWVSAASVGVWLRELGDYAGAMAILGEAAVAIRECLPSKRHPDMLWIEWQLAIVLRRLENPWLARRHNDTTAKIYRELLGEDHPNTRGCTLSLAADHHAIGNSALAVELAGGCLAGYERAGADHPCAAVCRMDLALYLRGNGDLAEASRHGEQAHAALKERLGANHPWTLNAAVNHASLLAGRGELDTAIELAEATDLVCRDLLGKDHPYTKVSEQNLSRMCDGAGSSTAGSGERGWAEMDIDVLPI